MCPISPSSATGAWPIWRPSSTRNGASSTASSPPPRRSGASAAPRRTVTTDAAINLTEVILRHGGEAEKEAERFNRIGSIGQLAITEFLETLVIFPPDDTASTLNPGNPADPNFPQSGHGSIKLGALFNDPADPE